MAPVNTRTAAVIDPILSTHARGYRNMEFVASALFPRVAVPNRSMRVIRFGKEAFRRLCCTNRLLTGLALSPGRPIPRPL